MNDKFPKILIVGGTGFLGFHLAKKCIKLKWKVSSISTKKPIEFRKIKSVKYYFFDISKKNSFFKISKKKFDYVVNFGGHVDHTNKKKTYNSHFVGLKNLVSFFEKKKLKRFIQVGSSSEYGKLSSPQNETDKCSPLLIYGKSKLRATKYLLKRKTKMPFAILRFYQIYGPYQSINRLIPFVIDSSLKDRQFKCSPGHQLRDFLFVNDAISAVLKSLKNKDCVGKVLNIGMGKGVKVRKLINYITKYTNKGIPVFNKVKLRIDEGKETFPNISLSSKILKWKPKVKLNVGLKRTIEHYKNNGRLYKNVKR